MIIYRAAELRSSVLNEEYVELLSLLEKINHCNQYYELTDNCLIVSYDLKLNLFNFNNIMPLKVKVQIIGLPISLSQKGYIGDLNNVIKIIKRRKGLKIILNADKPIIEGAKTLSSFVFNNNFETFDDYLLKLRSSYRRRINIALSKRSNLIIRKIQNSDFSENHYNLYLSIMKRTENPLETLPIEYFIDYEAEIYEFMDKSNESIVGFIQLKEFGDKLSDDKKKPIEDALEDLKKAYETKEVETIQPALDKINEAWKVASEEMYKAQAEQGGQPGAGGPQGGPGANGQPGGGDSKQGDDVEDVDFEEVK